MSMDAKPVSRQRRLQLERRAAGNCQQCNKPREHYANYCDGCAAQHRARQRERLGYNPGAPGKVGRPAKVADPQCLNCHKTVKKPRRGLCWSCFYTPEVRSLYPSLSKYKPTGGDFTGAAKECQPASVPLGSADKIAVMQERVANGQELFHRDDMAEYRERPEDSNPKRCRSHARRKVHRATVQEPCGESE